MTVEEVKKFAEEKYNTQLTDAQAEALIKGCEKEGALDDADLIGVTGGFSGHVGETVSKMLEELRKAAKKRL